MEKKKHPGYEIRILHLPTGREWVYLDTGVLTEDVVPLKKLTWEEFLVTVLKNLREKADDRVGMISTGDICSLVSKEGVFFPRQVLRDCVLQVVDRSEVL